jgi:hypothetical protein
MDEIKSMRSVRHQESTATASGTEDESKPFDRQSRPHSHLDTFHGNLPWISVVSYVDELTVGGRRDSKGHYTDGLGKFPGIGHVKPKKIPETCFPISWYDR